MNLNLIEQEDISNMKDIQDIQEKYKNRTVINSRYIFEKKIGSGSFGSVYRGKNIISEDKVAIKFEATTAKIPTLLWESKILNHLAGTPGVVKLRYFGTEVNKNIIVMDLYSHTLYDEVDKLKKSFLKLEEQKQEEQDQKKEEKQLESENDSPNNESPKREMNTSSKDITNDNDTKHDTNHDTNYDTNDELEVNIKDMKEMKEMKDIENDCIKEEQQGNITNNIPQFTKEVTQYLIKMLQIIHKVHDAGIVHRDIKPENFMISFSELGKEDSEKKVNIIDFGLSRFYMKGDKHIINTYDKSIVGTVRYISRHIHEGNVYSRRDDIISILYVAIYLLKGKLPWNGIVPKKYVKITKEELIYDKKIKTTSSELCEGLPPMYEKLVDYAYGLEFEEKPDYLYMIRQCKNLLKVI